MFNHPTPPLPSLRLCFTSWISARSGWAGSDVKLYKKISLDGPSVCFPPRDSRDVGCDVGCRACLDSKGRPARGWRWVPLVRALHCQRRGAEGGGFGGFGEFFSLWLSRRHSTEPGLWDASGRGVELDGVGDG